LESRTENEGLADWLRNARLLSRTGLGLVVVGIGLATAVRPAPGAFAAAALLALAGALIRFWSAGIIAKNKQLATSGPYAYVRNPLYFGSLLVAVAFFILNGNPWFVVPAAVGAVVLYMRTVKSEEAALAGHFGAAFEAYRATVPAILPWRGRCRLEGGETAYSLDQSLHNKEYNGALGTLGMLAAFYAYMHWLPDNLFRGVGALVVVVAVVLRGVRATRRVRAERAARAATPPPEADPGEDADAGRAGS